MIVIYAIYFGLVFLIFLMAGIIFALMTKSNLEFLDLVLGDTRDPYKD